MSKKTTIKEGGACTLNSDEIINGLRETNLDLQDHNNYLSRVVFEKNGQIQQAEAKFASLQQATKQQKNALLTSHLRERLELISKLMLVDQRLAVLGITNPHGPDAFSLVVNQTNLTEALS